MNPIKSPHELLMEQAGFAPQSPGLVNTGPQMLLNQSGIVPHFADGGQVGMSPQDMLAMLLAYGHEPQHFAAGGMAKNIGSQAAMSAPFITDELKQIAADIAKKKYAEAAARSGAEAYSAFTPFNPLTALISGLTYAPEVGDATLDAWNKQKAAEQEPAPAPAPKRATEQHNIIPFNQTRFYK